MGTIKVESDEYLAYHVNDEMLQNDEPNADSKPKIEFDVNNDGFSSAEDKFELEKETPSDFNNADNEWSYQNCDQYLKELKQEIIEQQERNDELCKDELIFDEQQNNLEPSGKEKSKPVRKTLKVNKARTIIVTSNRRYKVHEEPSKFYTIHYDHPAEEGTNSKPKSLECIFCKYTTEDRMKLIDHTKNIHQQFNCGLCKFVSPLEFCLKRHMAIQHPKFNHTSLQEKSYKCTMCDFHTKSLLRIKKHVDQTHLRQKQSKCKLCDFVSSCSRGVERHVSRVHLSTKRFKCESCNFRTSARLRLENHVNAIHLKLRNHKCHLCDFKATVKEYLNRHISFVHMNSDKRKHKCTYCKYATSRSSYLKIHINEVHLKLKNFECHLCSYKTGRKNYLEVHITSKHSHLHSHSDNCDSCLKAGKNVANTGKPKRPPKDLKCPHCELRFTRASALRDHVLSIHLKVKNFRCDICDFVTSLKKRLVSHVAAVHWKVKNHQCKFCEYRAFRKHQLDLHVICVHRKEKSEIVN